MKGTLYFGRRRLLRLPHLRSPAAAALSKIKLFVFFCVAVALLLLTASCAASVSLLRCHREVLSSASPRSKYTILINTWKRHNLLKQSVLHYASCDRVNSIQIVWSEPDPPPDYLHGILSQAASSKSNDGKDINIKFQLNQEDSLNNRFKDTKDLSTDAIFSIDDDVIVPCTSVEFAFSVWQSAPQTMVGFVPRVHWMDKSRDDIQRYRYGGWWSVWWTGTYSMVLSKASFFHKKYLDLYSNHMLGSIREFVTRNRNCEDIAMSFLVANTTGAPPIWVKGTISEIGSTGISGLGGHNEKRSLCLNYFSALYGHMPLVATSVKAIDSRHSWFW